ncbi:MAG: Re/Si-specific NAD(P)(+) transhydrogenase subunit alpha [Planctomycetes bacterium]|nr:Re/Si-specific NAD(P)(+) transhydrogenase subunit alpha [Planctomycetota bacterium]
MKIGVPQEVWPGECRVAASPANVKRLGKMGFSVLVESGAGAAASFDDETYRQAGAEVIDGTAALWEQSDIVIKVRAPMKNPETGVDEADLLREGGTLISFIWPGQEEELVKKLATRKATVLAMDCVPRISRAQKLDALSSMANIAGYRAVLEAAHHFGSFFTGQMTAAGKVPPAKVLVVGAGVAGLAAIGAAKGLGAIVRAFDTRPAVEEQVQSMGAEFLTVKIEEDGTGSGGYAKQMSQAFIDAEHALFEELAQDIDIIITTALIPGRPAPLLITEQAVKNMKPGSVIVDLAAERGGNTAGAVADQVVESHGVKIIGYTDLPSRMAKVSSNLYGNNICHLLDDMGGAENYKVDEADEVVRGTLVLNGGEMKWPAPVKKLAEETKQPEAVPGNLVAAAASIEKKDRGPLVLLLIGLALIAVGWSGDTGFLHQVTVFVLSCFIGYQVIWNVSASLHTPLMSVTNAISGIIIVGGMLQLGGPLDSPATILGVIAVFFATINIAGGFLVTQRMLKMFQR